MEKSKVEEQNEYINFYSKIVNKMDARRKELGLSLKEMEVTTGLCAAAISRMTNVLNKPRLDTFFKVLDALDLELKIVPKNENANVQNSFLETQEFYNVWVKKNNQIEVLKVQASTKSQAKSVVSETNPDWEICAVEKLLK